LAQSEAVDDVWFGTAGHRWLVVCQGLVYVSGHRLYICSIAEGYPVAFLAWPAFGELLLGESDCSIDLLDIPECRVRRGLAGCEYGQFMGAQVARAAPSGEIDNRDGVVWSTDMNHLAGHAGQDFGTKGYLVGFLAAMQSEGEVPLSGRLESDIMGHPSGQSCQVGDRSEQPTGD
jgi:hypothetical protein